MKKVKNEKVKTEPSKTAPAKAAPAPVAPVKLAAPIAQPVKPAPAKAVVAAAPAKPAAPKVNRVLLEVTEPGARQVCVAGTFNDWKPETTPLTRDADGKWFGDLAVKPGRYEYLFVVDGNWLADPKAKECVQNPFGGVNSVMLVSE